MKTFFTLLVLCFLGYYVVAQTPQAFKYQAVARDNSGNVLASRAVSFRISIVQGTVSGPVVYSELQSATTNAYGLVDFQIGKGSSPSGNFSTINWGTGDYFVKVEMDPAGGIAFQNLGTSQLLSVPYALRAKTVETESDGDPANEIQALSIAGTSLSLSKGGGTVTLPAGADNWGSQSVVSNATLEGSGTPASSLKIAQQGATSGQVLKWNGSTWLPGTDLTGTASPGGSSGHVQFNNGGAFGGDANLFWDNTNKRLGVGITTPGGLLELKANSTSSYPHLLLTESEGDFARLMFKNTVSSAKNWTIAGLNNTTDATSLLNFYHWNGSTGNDILSICGNGFVGIGTTVPYYNLSIDGGSGGSDMHLFNTASGITSTDGVRFGFSSAGANAWIWNYESGMLYFGTNNNQRMTILSNGNVGVGDVTPDATLDVEGTVVVGSGGVVFSEIKEITGTLDADGSYSFGYPTGYNMTNMRVLSVEVNYGGNSWTGISSTVNFTTDPVKLFYYLNAGSIYIYYPNLSQYQNRAFRMLVMKVQ
jgi:hypothetical protein